MKKLRLPHFRDMRLRGVRKETLPSWLRNTPRVLESFKGQLQGSLATK